jgi:hypothetical protein
MKRTLISTIVLFALLYLLIIIVAGRGILGMSVKKEIDPISLGGLAVSAFIAFFLQYFFASRAGDLRVEKDFLIENQKDVMKLTKECRDEVYKAFDAAKVTKASGEKIKLLLRELANALSIFEESLKASQCKSTSSEFETTKSIYYALKAAATGRGFPSKPYDSSAIIDFDRSYRLLRKNLQLWFFRINNFH